MYPINTYNTSTFSNSFAKFSPNVVYTYHIEVNSTQPNYIPTEYEYGSTKKNRTKEALSKQIEKVADYIAGLGGYMAGYPAGFAIGVLTRTNPLALGQTFGVAGSYLFPIIIKEIVT
tara:strand:+ start:722 stop:1072 length:351 start_codon:yes stop_codon:yes gene_type:complete